MEQVFAEVDIQSEFGKGFVAGTPFLTIGSIVSVIVQNAFVLAGIIAFVLLIVGGLKYIMSAGAGDTKQMEESQKGMTGAVAGLIIIIASFWIIQIIETLTGKTLLPFK